MIHTLCSLQVAASNNTEEKEKHRELHNTDLQTQYEDASTNRRSPGMKRFYTLRGKKDAGIIARPALAARS